MATRKRSIMKTITFRIIATITTMAFVLIFTGSLEIAGIIGVLEVVAKSILYYAHERVWSMTSWNKA